MPKRPQIIDEEIDEDIADLDVEISHKTLTPEETRERIESTAQSLFKKRRENVGSIETVFKNQISEITSESHSFYKGHLDSPMCITIDEKKQNIAYSSGKDCAIIQWDMTTGKKICISAGKRKDFESGGHFDTVNDVKVIHSGKHSGVLLSAGRDHLIRYWDFRVKSTSAKSVGHCYGHQDSVEGLAVNCKNSDSDFFYSISKDKTVRIWRSDFLTYHDALIGHNENRVGNIDIIGRDRPISAGGADQTVRIWKIHQNSHLLFNNADRLPNGYNSADYVSVVNNSHFIVSSESDSIRLFSTGSKNPLWVTDSLYPKTTKNRDPVNWSTAPIIKNIYDTNCLLVSNHSNTLSGIVYDQNGIINTTNIVPDLPININAIDYYSDDSGVVVFAVAGGRSMKCGRFSDHDQPKNGVCFGRIKME